MTGKTLSPSLFASFDLVAFANRLTFTPTGVDLVELLGESRVDSELLAFIAEVVDGAFLAGYMVGRDPDLLILADLIPLGGRQ